jgi:hypothetical protein
MADSYDVTSGEPLPSRKFSDPAELRELLAEEHIDGRFLYRGQVKRQIHEFEPEPGQLFSIESLYSNDFRFISKERKPRADKEWITSVRNRGRDIRDRFCEWMEDYVETVGRTLRSIGWRQYSKRIASSVSV